MAHDAWLARRVRAAPRTVLGRRNILADDLVCMVPKHRHAREFVNRVANTGNVAVRDRV